MSLSNINQATLMRAVGNGLSLAVIEEGVGDHKGRKALMAGGYMAGGSLVTDILAGVNPLASQSIFGPSAKAFSDSVFYTAIEALSEKSERSWNDAFRNFLYGFGASFLVGTVAAPLNYISPAVMGVAGPGLVPASVGAPAVPVNMPVSRTMTTSSF